VAAAEVPDVAPLVPGAADRPDVPPADEPRVPPAAADWSSVSAPGLPEVLPGVRPDVDPPLLPDVPGDAPVEPAVDPLADELAVDELPVPRDVPLAPEPALRPPLGPASE
jgi:hypothetical protein